MVLGFVRKGAGEDGRLLGRAVAVSASVIVVVVLVVVGPGTTSITGCVVRDGIAAAVATAGVLPLGGQLYRGRRERGWSVLTLCWRREPHARFRRDKRHFSSLTFENNGIFAFGFSFKCIVGQERAW